MATMATMFPPSSTPTRFAPNTLGFTDPATQAAIPFPRYVLHRDRDNSLGFGNYNAGTISVKKRAANFQFELSYTYTRDLTNVNGAPIASASGFANEFGNTLSDPHNPGLDYGNTPFARRERVLATFLYELPFGKGRTFLNGNGLLDRVVGGWELSGVVLFQSGPFMSVATLDDPSGTGYNLFNSNGGRADTVPGVSPYAGQSINQWINPNAFVDPANNIGRFGDSNSGVNRRAWHTSCFAVADQTVHHQGTDSGRDWNAGLQRVQPRQLRSSRHPDAG